MSEILHNGLNERPDALSDSGDVIPIDDAPDLEVENLFSVERDIDVPELETDNERALRESLEERDQAVDGQVAVPRQVMDLLHDAASEEDRLRGFGRTQKRIDESIGKTVIPKLLKLGFDGIDTSNAYPPTSPKTTKVDVVKTMHVSDEDSREKKIEHIMDTQGISWADAERRV